MNPGCMSREVKIDICTKRIDGMSMAEIGERYGVTRQAVSKFFSRLTDNHLPGNCPYPAIRRWFKKTTYSLEELAELIGWTPEALDKALFVSDGVPMPVELANALSDVTGIPVEVLSEYHAPRAPRHENTPTEQTLGSIQFPDVIKIMRYKHYTMRKLSEITGIPYQRLRKRLIEIPSKSIDHYPDYEIIAKALDAEYPSLFDSRRKAGRTRR